MRVWGAWEHTRVARVTSAPKETDLGVGAGCDTQNPPHEKRVFRVFDIRGGRGGRLMLNNLPEKPRQRETGHRQFETLGR